MVAGEAVMTGRAMNKLCVLGLSVSLFLGAALAWGQDSIVMHGIVSDYAGNPVSGAEVGIYRSRNVKKPADFVSNRTGKDGVYQVALPAGAYWGVALLRKDGRKFGPLGPGDKYSGEAVEVLVEGQELEMDFAVLDLREAARKVQKKNEELVRVSGRVLDDKGRPVEMAYAMANPVNRFKEMPRYLSAWTGVDGAYVLFLPKGAFYFGAATGFPPDSAYILHQDVTLEGDLAGYDIVVPVEE